MVNPLHFNIACHSGTNYHAIAEYCYLARLKIVTLAPVGLFLLNASPQIQPYYTNHDSFREGAAMAPTYVCKYKKETKIHTTEFWKYDIFVVNLADSWMCGMTPLSQWPDRLTSCVQINYTPSKWPRDLFT